MQKAVNIEAKIGLRFNIMVENLNTYCSRDHRLSHNTSSKMQNQDFNNKNSFCSKKPKPKNSKPALPCDNIAAKLAKKKDKKDKKKRF